MTSPEMITMQASPDVPLESLAVWQWMHRPGISRAEQDTMIAAVGKRIRRMQRNQEQVARGGHR